MRNSCKLLHDSCEWCTRFMRMVHEIHAKHPSPWTFKKPPSPHLSPPPPPPPSLPPSPPSQSSLSPSMNPLHDSCSRRMKNVLLHATARHGLSEEALAVDGGAARRPRMPAGASLQFHRAEPLSVVRKERRLPQAFPCVEGPHGTQSASRRRGVIAGRGVKCSCSLGELQTYV